MFNAIGMAAKGRVVASMVAAMVLAMACVLLLVQHGKRS